MARPHNTARDNEGAKKVPLWCRLIQVLTWLYWLYLLVLWVDDAKHALEYFLKKICGLDNPTLVLVLHMSTCYLQWLMCKIGIRVLDEAVIRPMAEELRSMNE